MLNNTTDYDTEQTKNFMDDELKPQSSSSYEEEERKAFEEEGCSILEVAAPKTKAITLKHPSIEPISFQDFVYRIENKTGTRARQNGKGYSVCCPAHDDKNPSLSVTEGDDGRILAKCFAGCTFEEICSSLGIEPSALFPQGLSESYTAALKRIVYPYEDEYGKVLYNKIRMEPGFEGASKSFYFERKTDSGECVRGLDGCQKIFYRLPELIDGINKGAPIFLVEGEKDADTLADHGFIATTAHATSYWSDDFTVLLKPADVVILYDMDATGLKRRDFLCKQLVGKVKRLRVVDLPGLEYSESHGKDVSDWLLLPGNNIVRLMDIVEATADYQPAAQSVNSVAQEIKSSYKLRVVSVNEFLKMDIPPREMLLAPFLQKQGIAMLYAYRGVGKTHVALGTAYAVATGGTFLKWEAPTARKVIYIDGEMPAFAIQERLRKICEFSDHKLIDPDFFRLITPDLQDDVVPDLSTKEGRERIGEVIGDSDLIIVDNISTLLRSGNENEAESWQEAQDWALAQRRDGKSVLFVHHAGKTGNQRGTSKREDILDAVISLKRPEGYKPEQGACFEVHFEKARSFTGEDASPFLAELKEQSDGTWRWETNGIAAVSSIADDEIAVVAELKRQGLTIAEISKKTGLSKSKVETRLAKAKMMGIA